MPWWRSMALCIPSSMLPPPEPAHILSFDPKTAPPNSRWVPPKWVTQSKENTKTMPTQNGLGQPWDFANPKINGVDLTKPDTRLKLPNIEITTTESEKTIALVNVNILDCTGNEPFPGDVLIKGNKIVHVGGKLSKEQIQGAQVFEGNGKTLMSGLVDAHTHFTWTNAPSLDALSLLPLEEHTIFALKSAQTFLDCGYTMCFGAASARARLDLVIKNAIQNGTIPGPRFLANGKEMAPAAGCLDAGITQFVETKEEIVQIINQMADIGIDQCKLSMSGEEITEHLRAEDTTFSDILVAAGVEAAHSRGMRVCSHARSDEAVLQCLQYGVDMIYHASFISDATMDALEAQKDRVFVAPAINFLVATLENAGEEFAYPASKAEAVGYQRELEIAIEALKEMHKRGIKILPGGDYGFAWTPHGTYHDLEHFVNLLKMTPMEAIVSATKYGGELLGHPNHLGTVTIGAFADLILVNGNPLDDITLLSNKKNLAMIIINGKIHKTLISVK